MFDNWIVNFLLLIIIILSGYILYLLNKHNKLYINFHERHLVKVIIFISLGVLVLQLGEAVPFDVSQHVFIPSLGFISSYGSFALYLIVVLLYMIVKQPPHVYKFPTVIICLITWPCYLLSVHYSMMINGKQSSDIFVILSNLFTALFTVAIGLILKGSIDGSLKNKKALYSVFFITFVFCMVALGMVKDKKFSWAEAVVSAMLANTFLERLYELLKEKNSLWRRVFGGKHD